MLEIGSFGLEFRGLNGLCLFQYMFQLYAHVPCVICNLLNKGCAFVLLLSAMYLGLISLGDNKCDGSLAVAVHEVTSQDNASHIIHGLTISYI